MTNWRDLEGGLPLNQIVAEHLGWRIEPLSAAWVAVFNADGVGVERTTAYGSKNEWPLYDLDEAIPHYSTDANAALALPLEPDMYFSLDVPAEHGGAKCGLWNQYPRSVQRKLVEGEAVADTPALAICRAWLDWKEQQRD